MSSEPALKIALAMSRLVDESVAQLEIQMDLLNVPRSVRAAMWQVVCRQAMAKAIECELTERERPSDERDQT